MKYQWVLFDADHTLFDFDSFTGLNTVLAQYGISLTRAEYDDFQRINQPLWTDYQNGKIGIAELSEIRFAKLAARAGIAPLALNARLQQEMAHISRLLPHARETLDTLKANGTSPTAMPPCSNPALMPTAFQAALIWWKCPKQSASPNPMPACLPTLSNRWAIPTRTAC